MQQNTSDWELWRNDGIGSSDAPVIMGDSPYKTINQLYWEKKGRKVSEKEQKAKQFIFDKGHSIEKEARSLVEILSGGHEFRAGLIQMKDHPYFRVSMDGANFELGIAKEFKLVGIKEFNEGVCPARYYAQIQHQYMVSGIDHIDIVLCIKVKGKLRIKEIHVPVDLDYIHHKLVPGLLEFWFCHLIPGIPPRLERGDAIRIKDKALISHLKKIKQLSIKRLKLENELEKCEKAIEFSQMYVNCNLPGELSYYQKDMFRKYQITKTEVRKECY